MKLRKEANANRFYRDLLAILGQIGGIGYLSYHLLTKQIDPIMEGIAFMAILFGIVGIAKTVRPLKESFKDHKNHKEGQKELDTLLDESIRSAPTKEEK